LMSNYKLIEEDGNDMVSNLVYTAGKNIIDQSFIAQTYGFKSKTICLPGSLINKDIFTSTGYLIESVRAGYDVDFINKIEKLNIKRVINTEVCLKYFDFNYCQSYLSGFKKVYTYSLSGWETKGDLKPFIYMGMFILFLFIVYIEHYYLLGFYISVRAVIIPFMKSNYKIEMLMPHRILFNFIAGILIELSRMIAYMNIFKIIRKKIEQVIAKDANQLQEKGYQEYFLDDEGSGSIEVYKIIEKGKSLRVKLSITDRPLSPGEL